MRKFRQEIPTYDFFEREPQSDFDLQEILEDFVFSMETNYFLLWEAVICQEQNIELTESQEKQLDKLINFREDDDEEILYINEVARPNKKWYAIANHIAEKLIKGRIATYELHSVLISEGWGKLKKSIVEHGAHLSKPKGVKNAIEVIPEEIRHQLEIQESVDWLVGLGQDEELKLTNPDQIYRMEELIRDLKTKIESIKYLQLSTEMIVSKFIELREEDEIKFKEYMVDKLGLKSTEENLTDKLKEHYA